MVKKGKETGHEKAAQYKDWKEHFESALGVGCYLECIFIDYAMMEDRLLSILHHLNIADRERGDGRGWAKTPADKRLGYKNALRPMPKLRKDGSLPRLDNISTKIEVLRTLATLEGSSDCCNDFEHWLRTDVHDKLVAYNAVDICDHLSTWIARRNDLVHALFGARTRDYDALEIERLAREGMSLAGQLDNLAGAMKTQMAKYEKKRLILARAKSKKRR